MKKYFLKIKENAFAKLEKGIKNEYISITSFKDYDEILNEIEGKVNDKNMIYIYKRFSHIL